MDKTDDIFFKTAYSKEEIEEEEKQIIPDDAFTFYEPTEDDEEDEDEEYDEYEDYNYIEDPLYSDFTHQIRDYFNKLETNKAYNEANNLSMEDSIILHSTLVELHEELHRMMPVAENYYIR